MGFRDAAALQSSPDWKLLDAAVTTATRAAAGARNAATLERKRRLAVQMAGDRTAASLEGMTAQLAGIVAQASAAGVHVWHGIATVLAAAERSVASAGAEVVAVSTALIEDDSVLEQVAPAPLPPAPSVAPSAAVATSDAAAAPTSGGEGDAAYVMTVAEEAFHREATRRYAALVDGVSAAVAEAAAQVAASVETGQRETAACEAATRDADTATTALLALVAEAVAMETGGVAASPPAGGDAGGLDAASLHIALARIGPPALRDTLSAAGEAVLAARRAVAAAGVARKRVHDAGGVEVTGLVAVVESAHVQVQAAARALLADKTRRVAEEEAREAARARIGPAASALSNLLVRAASVTALAPAAFSQEVDAAKAAVRRAQELLTTHGALELLTATAAAAEGAVAALAAAVAAEEARRGELEAAAGAARAALSAQLERLARVRALAEVAALGDHPRVAAAYATAVAHLRALSAAALGTEAHPALEGGIGSGFAAPPPHPPPATAPITHARQLTALVATADEVVAALERTTARVRSSREEVERVLTSGGQAAAIASRKIGALAAAVELLEMGALPALAAQVAGAQAACEAATAALAAASARAAAAAGGGGSGEDDDGAVADARVAMRRVAAAGAAVTAAEAAVADEQALQVQASVLRRTAAATEKGARAAQRAEAEAAAVAANARRASLAGRLEGVQVQFTALLREREAGGIRDCIPLARFVGATEAALEAAQEAVVAEDVHVAEAALSAAVGRLAMCSAVAIRVAGTRDAARARIAAIAHAADVLRGELPAMAGLRADADALASMTALCHALAAAAASSSSSSSRGGGGDEDGGLTLALSSEVGLSMRLLPAEVAAARALAANMGAGVGELFADLTSGGGAAASPTRPPPPPPPPVATASAAPVPQVALPPAPPDRAELVSLTAAEIAGVVARVSAATAGKPSAGGSLAKAHAISAALAQLKREKFEAASAAYAAATAAASRREAHATPTRVAPSPPPRRVSTATPGSPPPPPLPSLALARGQQQQQPAMPRAAVHLLRDVDAAGAAAMAELVAQVDDLAEAEAEVRLGLSDDIARLRDRVAEVVLPTLAAGLAAPGVGSGEPVRLHGAMRSISPPPPPPSTARSSRLGVASVGGTGRSGSPSAAGSPFTTRRTRPSTAAALLRGVGSPPGRAIAMLPVASEEGRESGGGGGDEDGGEVTTASMERAVAAAVAAVARGRSVLARMRAAADMQVATVHTARRCRMALILGTAAVTRFDTLLVDLQTEVDAPGAAQEIFSYDRFRAAGKRAARLAATARDAVAALREHGSEAAAAAAADVASAPLPTSPPPPQPITSPASTATAAAAAAAAAALKQHSEAVDAAVGALREVGSALALLRGSLTTERARAAAYLSATALASRAAAAASRARSPLPRGATPAAPATAAGGDMPPAAQHLAAAIAASLVATRTPAAVAPSATASPAVVARKLLLGEGPPPGASRSPLTALAPAPQRTLRTAVATRLAAAPPAVPQHHTDVLPPLPASADSSPNSTATSSSSSSAAERAAASGSPPRSTSSLTALMQRLAAGRRNLESLLSTPAGAPTPTAAGGGGDRYAAISALLRALPAVDDEGLEADGSAGSADAAAAAAITSKVGEEDGMPPRDGDDAAPAGSVDAAAAEYVAVSTAAAARARLLTHVPPPARLLTSPPAPGSYAARLAGRGRVAVGTGVVATTSPLAPGTARSGTAAAAAPPSSTTPPGPITSFARPATSPRAASSGAGGHHGGASRPASPRSTSPRSASRSPAPALSADPATTGTNGPPPLALTRLASPRALGRIDVTSGESLRSQSMRWRWGLRDS